MQRSSTIALLPGLLLALCAGSALAADNGKINTLGNASAKAPILSKAELRACLSKQAELARAGVGLDERVRALNLEGEELSNRRNELKTEVDAFHSRDGAVQQFNDRQSSLAARIKDWNQAKKEFEEDTNMSDATRLRRQRNLEGQLKELQKSESELNTEKQALVASIQKQGEDLQTHQGAFNESLERWKAKQSALSNERASYELDRDEWRQACGNRRYREDDETALRAGK